MLKECLRDSWSFFKVHYVALAMITLPILTPVYFLLDIYEYNFITEESSVFEIIAPSFLASVFYPIYAVGVVFYIAKALSGELLSPVQAWKLGLSHWTTYIILSLLMWLLIGLGFMALVIPGFILLVRYSFAQIDLLLNKSTPVTSLKNSWSLTENYFWLLLGGFAVITLAIWIPAYLVNEVFNFHDAVFYLVNFLWALISSVLSAIYTIFAFRVYELTKSEEVKDQGSESLKN